MKIVESIQANKMNLTFLTDKNSLRRDRGKAILLSLALYVVSLIATAVMTTSGPIKGYSFFLMGWLGIFQGYFTWFANVIYFVSLGLVLACKYKPALFLSFLALIVCGDFLLHHHNIALNEGGVPDFMSFEAGYYLWMVSIGILLLFSLIASYLQRGD